MPGNHGAGHQPSHGVGEQPDRLAVCLRLVQFGLHPQRQPVRLLFDRKTPVEGKFHHLVRLSQVLDQLTVEAGIGVCRMHAARIDTQLCEFTQGQSEQIDPDAVASDLEFAAHDAGQDKHHRSRTRLGAARQRTRDIHGRLEQAV